MSFVHLHTHSEFSPLDGLSTIREIFQEAVADNQPAVGLTDHGTNAGHPELQRVADEFGIKPIFGIEAYFVDDRLIRPESGDKEAQKALRKYYHLILLAQNEEGLKNIWRASTESEKDGFYHKPRMDWSTLEKYSEGVVASTGCLQGPLSFPLQDDDEEKARTNLMRLLNIYGDNLYVELHTNQLQKQHKVNHALVEMAQRYSVPTLAVVDSHFPTKEHMGAHNTWIACQTNKDVQDEGDLFAEELDLYVQTEAEVRESLSYLPESIVNEAIDNTVFIADKADAKMEGSSSTPIYIKDGGYDRDAERLFEVCMENWGKLIDTGVPQEEYIARFEREFSLISRKAFCGYYLMVRDYCLDPSTPVLTRDLNWVEVGKLSAGDKLVAFDENKVKNATVKAHRYWRDGEVVSTRRINLPTYRVTLSDGTETIASESHQWLAASPSGANIRWIKTQDLKVGERPQRVLSEWKKNESWEAGYLSGILDGEGFLSCYRISNGGTVFHVGFSQNEGAVLDMALRILDSMGFDYSVRNHSAGNKVRNVVIKGGRSEVLRLLGTIQPPRLMEKVDIGRLGRLTQIDMPFIEKIEFLGEKEVVALETTTSTLIAQGFAHHNCDHARLNKILVGPGRGSGAASLLAYLCNITAVDPVKNNLLFERFMTEGRTSLPDFDCVAGSTEFHRDGPGDKTVGGLYALIHGRPTAVPGECEVCGTEMESIKRGYKGNPSKWVCKRCYKKRHHLKAKGLPSILGRNVLGRLSNQPLLDILYKGVRETLRITSSDGRFIESTPEHRHLTSTGWKEAKDIHPGELLVLMDDKGLRASHTDNLSRNTKERLFDRAGWACEMCHKKAPSGESWLGKFEIAHLDYSTKNIDNMLFLCTPCHRKMDGQIGTPVVLRTVANIEHVGEQPVYDVVMGHDDHSWVANGFVTHNCDFPASKREDIQNYIRERFGEEYVLRVGTHLRYKNKGVFAKLFSALASQLHEDSRRDAVVVSKVIEDAEADTAGLGLSWEELWAKVGDELAPYQDKYPQVFEMAEVLNGRLNSYGRHAAALVISSEEKLHDSLPLRRGEEGAAMISQFEAPDLEWLGHVKFDILTLRTLDTIQETVDLIRDKRGVEVDPYSWSEEYEDSAVWDAIGNGDTLGMFQVETNTGTKMAKDMRPRNIPELSDLVALVRPGPMRSGLTEIYLERRAGTQEVTYDLEELRPILGRTQGVPVYQESLMQTAIDIAGFTSDEADVLRSVLGKKKKDQIPVQGEKFISQSVERGFDRRKVEKLWEGFTEFGLYGFNLAHSWSYAVLAYWTQWLKINYPVEFYTAVLSTVDKEKIPEFVQNARSAGISILPQDINESGREFEITENGEIRYSLGSIKGIGAAAVKGIVEGQPYESFEDFRERSGANKTVVKLLARIGAFGKLPDGQNRRALINKLEREALGLDKKCVFKHEEASEGAPNGLPCTFDWSNEPVPVNIRTGKKQRPKPIPKKCTIRCRNYTPPEPMDDSTVEDYGDAEIREIENELLGVYLSSTPFDDVDDGDRMEVREQADLLLGGNPGMFTLVGILTKSRDHRTKTGNKMLFGTLETEAGAVEFVAFNDVLEPHREMLRAGAFLAVEVLNTTRGAQLKSAIRIH